MMKQEGKSMLSTILVRDSSTVNKDILHWNEHVVP